MSRRTSVSALAPAIGAPLNHHWKVRLSPMAPTLNSTSEPGGAVWLTGSPVRTGRRLGRLAAPGVNPLANQLAGSNPNAVDTFRCKEEPSPSAAMGQGA